MLGPNKHTAFDSTIHPRSGWRQVGFISLAFLMASGFSVSVARAGTPTTLRLASIAPAGTSWDREGKSFATEVDYGTDGQVLVRWFLGGIAGDERTVLSRIQRGQLDGEGGTSFCAQLGPSMRVLEATGLYSNAAEWSHVLSRLRPVIDQEFEKSGYKYLGANFIGTRIVLSRRSLRNLGDLRRDPFYIWDLDEVLRSQLAQVGMHLVPLPLDQAANAYAKGKTDGFITFATAALAFQWSAQASYFSSLVISYAPVCLCLANRVFDTLQYTERAVVQSAAAKLMRRMEEVNKAQENELLGSLFDHQGVHRVDASEIFQRQFQDVARQTTVPESLVPKALYDHVKDILAQYRNLHP